MNTTTPTKLTVCPHCQSIFDVSEEEMQLALGAVRCGECMKIFNASYHLVDLPEANTSSQQNFTPSNEEKADDPAALSIQNTKIPTLQEHPPASLPNQPVSLDEVIALEDEEDDFSYIDSLLKTDKANTDENEAENETDQATNNKSQKKLSKPFIASLFVLIAAILVGSWVFSNSATPNYYQFTEVRLSPANDPKKMDVHFKLTNTSQQKLALPSLNIQLLNLSSQPISSEIITSNNLATNFRELEAGTSQAITVSVNRPSTFVQSALIQAHLEDAKL